MKKSIKINTFLIIILLIELVYCHKVEVNKENATRKYMDSYSMIDVQIIDKYNKMHELYEDPAKEEYVLVDIKIDGKYYHNVGIRTKGNIIYKLLERDGLDNYSFKVKLDYTDKDQRYNGMNELHLNTTYYDDTGIREHMIYEMYNKMGIQTQQYYFGHLHIGDVDRGLITIVEVITEEYMENLYGSEDGNIYKPMRISDDDFAGADFRYVGDNQEAYGGIFNNTKTSETTEEDKDRLINIIKNINESSETEVIENSFMDFDKIIKMVAINKVLVNIDVFTGRTLKNFFIYEKNGKIDILTFDFDKSLNIEVNKKYWTEDTDEMDLAKCDVKVYSRIIDIIIENEEYTKKYYQYVEETMQMLKDMEIEKVIDQKYNITKDAIKSNEKKIYSYSTYERGIKELKRFLKRRANMDIQEENIESTREDNITEILQKY